MNTKALGTANESLKKALYWIIVSGAATTVLTGLLALLSQLESGEMDWRRFFSMAGILVVNGLLNGLVYWVAEYRKAQ